MTVRALAASRRKAGAPRTAIHVTPNGSFVYGAVRTTSTLHGYKIDPDKGTLTAIGKWPTEKTPRGFNIDPRGKFLLSVGMESNAMTVYASVNENQSGSGGLIKTANDGQSWTAIGPGTSPNTIPVSAVDAAPDGTIFAGTVGRGIWRFGL